MKLWETQKDRFASASKTLLEEWAVWKKATAKHAEAMAKAFGNRENSEAFAKYWRDSSDKIVNSLANDIRDAKEVHNADLALTQYSGHSNLAWVMEAILALNEVVTQNREFTARLLEAVQADSSEKAEKLAQLAKEQADRPALTQSQLKALGTFQRFYEETLASKEKGKGLAIG